MSSSENMGVETDSFEMTGHLLQASNALIDFLKSTDDRVFVLKGPYGAGKSYFLRRFLASKNGQAAASKLRFLSYSSVFGVNDLKELQNVIIGSIGLLKLGDKNMMKAGLFDKALSLLQKGISPLLGGMNLELSAGSLIWSVAKHQGLLLVIDDIDRKGPQLPIESIVGFANSLAEHSDGMTKVVFVLNEEQLGDDAPTWSKLREKFIDCEYRFYPSPEELAQNFVDDANVRDSIGRIHLRLNRPNIRTMRKIQSMVGRFSDHLKEQQIEINQEETTHAVRCAALFLHSGVTFQTKDLLKIYTKNWYIRDSDPPSEEERQLFELMELIEFSPDSDLDALAFGYFKDGGVEKAPLEAFRQNRMNNMARARYESEQRELWSHFNANFLGSEQLFIEKSKALLEASRESLNLRDLNSILTVLQALGVDVEDEWKYWLQSRLPRLNTESIRTVRQIIPESLHSMIDEQENLITEAIDATSVFREIHEGDGFGSQEAIAKLAQWTEEDYLEWFSKCEDSNLFSQLREFLRFKHESGNLLTINQTLTKALQTQSKSSTFDSIRIRQFFGNLVNIQENPADVNASKGN